MLSITSLTSFDIHVVSNCCSFISCISEHLFKVNVAYYKMQAMDEQMRNLESMRRSLSQEIVSVKQEVQRICECINKGFLNMEHAINKKVRKVAL